MNAIQRTTYIMYQPPNHSDRNMTCHTINRTPFTIRKNNNRMAFIFKFSYRFQDVWIRKNACSQVFMLCNKFQFCRFFINLKCHNRIILKYC